MSKTRTRKDTAARKESLCADLRALGRAGSGTPGNIMISVRELAAKYELALWTVSVELQKLAEEGVLYTIPRVGTFIGRPARARNDIFVALFPSHTYKNSQFASVRSGFEERISQLGGTSLVVDNEVAHRYHVESDLIAPAGIFEFGNNLCPSRWLLSGGPHVQFGEVSKDKPTTDMVYFDNVGGGQTATQHLIALGHQRITFLGLHGEEGDAGFYAWSKQREDGWRRSLVQAGLPTHGMAFHPSVTPEFELLDVAQKASESAENLLRVEQGTAVIAVNAFATLALIEKLKAARRPVDSWPAIVTFDSDVGDDEAEDYFLHLITALRLPWEEIGREAANLLWERSQGRSSGPPQQRLVPMSLIARLSCHQDWHRAPLASTPAQSAAKRQLTAA